jgi:uncharacterized repeat protein (TIGR04052 family)
MTESRASRFSSPFYLVLALACWATCLACSSPDTPASGAEPLAPGIGAPGAAGAEPTLEGPVRAPPPDAAPAQRAVRVRFRAVVADEPFACGATYAGADGVAFAGADLRAFVQDVALLDANGVEVPVALDVRPPWQQGSVALIDFEDGSAACAAGTRDVNLEVSGMVPQGDYRGLVFSNGVPEALNHADPAQLPPPLQAGSMTWGWLLGYRFLMAEVVALPGDAGAPGSALLHVGSAACTGNPSQGGVTCGRANRNRVRLDDFDPDEDVVLVDLGRLFAGVDLTAVTTCHSSGAECEPFFERVGLDLALGSAIEPQQLYRVGALDEGAP